MADVEIRYELDGETGTLTLPRETWDAFRALVDELGPTEVSRLLADALGGA